MQLEQLKPECSQCSQDGTCYDKLRIILDNTSGRLTDERRHILRLICDMEGHFRPETLVAMLHEQGHKVSLTTVYRNLSLLVQAGIIRRTDVQETGRLGVTWYEHIWGHQHHDHLVCSSCGRRVEFSYPAIDVLQEAVAREHGFTMERHCLELVGVCPDCRQGYGGPDK
jgi:Fur family transcriptional regulator, ferric uptake regulator